MRDIIPRKLLVTLERVPYTKILQSLKDIHIDSSATVIPNMDNMESCDNPHQNNSESGADFQETDERLVLPILSNISDSKNNNSDKSINLICRESEHGVTDDVRHVVPVDNSQEMEVDIKDNSVEAADTKSTTVTDLSTNPGVQNENTAVDLSSENEAPVTAAGHSTEDTAPNNLIIDESEAALEDESETANESEFVLTDQSATEKTVSKLDEVVANSPLLSDLVQNDDTPSEKQEDVQNQTSVSPTENGAGILLEKISSNLKTLKQSSPVDLSKSAEDGAQKENIKPDTLIDSTNSDAQEDATSFAKKLDFLINDVESEDIYVTAENHMVSSRTGYIIEPKIQFPNKKNNPNDPIEPGEIRHKENGSTGPKSRADLLKGRQGAPGMQNGSGNLSRNVEDYAWVSRLRDLYRKLKLPANITNELDQYWKHIDTIDENITRKEIELIELKGQKRWLITMLTKTLDSYPIPPGHKDEFKSKAGRPPMDRAAVNSRQLVSAKAQAEGRPGTTQGTSHSRNSATALPYISYNRRTEDLSHNGWSGYNQKTATTPAGQYSQPASKKMKLTPQVAQVQPWAMKGDTTGSRPVLPPPAHMKNDSPRVSTAMKGPPPAHGGDRLRFTSHRGSNPHWPYPMQDYWASYLQAYNYRLAGMDKNANWTTSVAKSGKTVGEGYKSTAADSSSKPSSPYTTNSNSGQSSEAYGRKGALNYSVTTKGQTNVPRSLENTGLIMTPSNVDNFLRTIITDSNKQGKSSTDRQSAPATESTVNSNDGTHVCAACGGPAVQVCSGCTKVWYCGEACQLQAWATHSLVCGKT